MGCTSSSTSKPVAAVPAKADAVKKEPISKQNKADNEQKQNNVKTTVEIPHEKSTNETKLTANNSPDENTVITSGPSTETTEKNEEPVTTTPTIAKNLTNAEISEPKHFESATADVQTVSNGSLVQDTQSVGASPTEKAMLPNNSIVVSKEQDETPAKDETVEDNVCDSMVPADTPEPAMDKDTKDIEVIVETVNASDHTTASTIHEPSPTESIAADVKQLPTTEAVTVTPDATLPEVTPADSATEKEKVDEIVLSTIREENDAVSPDTSSEAPVASAGSKSPPPARSTSMRTMATADAIKSTDEKEEDMGIRNALSTPKADKDVSNALTPPSRTSSVKERIRRVNSMQRKSSSRKFSSDSPLQSNKQEYDYLVKVVMLGDCASGKSSLQSRFIDDAFRPAYKSTVGTDFKFKTAVVAGGSKCKIQCWDTSGKERLLGTSKEFFLKMLGFVLVYDITNEESFNNIKNIWLKKTVLPEGTAHTDLVAKVLVANKADEEDPKPRVITQEMGAALAAELGVKFYEVSAKQGFYVEDAFMSVTNQVIQNIKSHEDQYGAYKQSLY